MIAASSLNRAQCCDQCRHTDDAPCPERIECMLEGPRCHEHEDIAAAVELHASALRRETVTRPVIFAGASIRLRSIIHRSWRIRRLGEDAARNDSRRSVPGS